ncbi:hypothetical protein B0J13DRAFT_68422 [Dactylonectria estremocensis]|uniref:Zn(2)-C6 fungal-type domain-containing protein n=1 Tax=Dactylonectria estremocensis TaxID=1079267 RepID=A0A9P9ELJ1_9HYPO|nr:hypothetical protein B0J13DRAFT_68422 [Dactylonectria estremocensis]
MSRRHHKKSRNGCLECKRRHIKCDEQQPVCANCGAAEMRCSFLSRDLPYIVPVFAQVHSYVAASSTFPAIAPAPALVPSPTPTSTSTPEHCLSANQPVDPYNVNVTHFALFNNLSSEGFLDVENSVEPDVIPLSIYINHAVTTPYLMHQILAVSALHLCTKAVEPRAFYREYATGLQNRALSLFNESNPVLEVTPANCVPMFLFSTLVSGQLLFDTLHFERNGLENFIDRFTHCLSVCRGVLAVIDECKHLLQDTELGPLLDAQSIMQPMKTSGSECDGLLDLIQTADVSGSTRKTYRDQVLYLQRAFNAQGEASGRKVRLPAIFAWVILVTPDYIQLLRQRQPISLVILAHYAVLLHRGRGLWAFGDGGAFLIESIRDNLGPSWHEALNFPTAALSEV